MIHEASLINVLCYKRQQTIYGRTVIQPKIIVRFAFNSLKRQNIFVLTLFLFLFVGWLAVVILYSFSVYIKLEMDSIRVCYLMLFASVELPNGKIFTETIVKICCVDHITVVYILFFSIYVHFTRYVYYFSYGFYPH